MKLIKASYKILTPIDGERILKDIELAARTCYKSEDKIEYANHEDENREGISKHLTDNYYAISARILIPKLITRGHEAMLEFGGTITVRFIVDRGVSHELVRHRLASFAQESTRYCNYGKDEHITFIIPNWLQDNLIEGVFNHPQTLNKDERQWISVMENAEFNYNILLSLGWTPQQARSVLPNSLKTEINVSANIREWRHIFKQRTDKTAHPQMREVMIPLLKEFQTYIPILFDDILV